MSHDAKSGNNVMAHIKCKTGEQLSIKAHVTKYEEIKLAFPVQYNASFPSKNSRPCCTFSRRLGSSDAFYNHIKMALAREAKNFTTVEYGRKWCKEQRLKWKKNVEGLWESHIKTQNKKAEPTRKSRMEAFTSARAYNNENRALMTIPLPDFLNMGSVVKPVASISINIKKNSRSQG